MTESELHSYTVNILDEIELERDAMMTEMAERGHRRFRYRLDGNDIDRFIEAEIDGRRLSFGEFMEIKERVAAELSVDLAYLPYGQRGVKW
jgi:hypothetical protein